MNRSIAWQVANYGRWKMENGKWKMEKKLKYFDIKNKDLTANTIAQLKILYLIKTMGVGGAERFTFNLCKYFSDKSNSVTVYSSGGIFADELNRTNVTCINSSFAESKNLPAIRSELKQIIIEEGFDIIHVQHRIFLPLLMTLNTGSAKIIYTANNFFNDFYQKLIFPDAAVAISPSIENNLLKSTLINRTKIFKINYGVEVKETFRSPGNNITLGFVGRLIKEKGIYQLIDAFRKIKSDRLKLIICGNGPEKNNILKLIETGNTCSKIEYLSPAINIDDIYSLIDVLVLPTLLNEGLPISILEALARKIIVITTKSGAITDVITDNETGLLLEDYSEKSIINKINYLLESSGDMSVIRENGYNKVKSDYSIEIMLKGYEKLYLNC